VAQALLYYRGEGFSRQEEKSMAESKRWSRWWRKFLGLSPDGYHRAVELLRERFLDESQHVTRFTQHAEKMQYPQFREKLLSIAAEEAKHVEWIAEKIGTFGGQLPAVPEVTPSEKNSWQYLLADLEAERLCAAELEEEIQEIQPELPAVAEMLERIHEDGKRHRKEIREMLMRSDPQALWPA
jgi:rubrerythrin